MRNPVWVCPTMNQYMRKVKPSLSANSSAWKQPPRGETGDTVDHSVIFNNALAESCYIFQINAGIQYKELFVGLFLHFAKVRLD